MSLRSVALATGLSFLLPLGASAVPLLDLAEPVVAPGAPVDVTVLGPPGHHFALAGSAANAGLQVAGRALQLGPDARVLATGQLDAEGRAAVSLTADFAGGDRLHLQAVTAPGPGFEGFASTPGKVLRNASLWLPATLGVTLPGPGARASLSTAETVVAVTAGAPLAAQPATASGAARPGPVAAGSPAPRAAARSEVSAAWLLGGNAGTDPASQFVGTTDAQPLELRVASQRVLRLEPPGTAHPIYGAAPSVVAGTGVNAVEPGVVGATIGGGGAPEGSCAGVGTPCPNEVTDAFGTVGGGVANRAGDDAGSLVDRAFATVGGGFLNTASGDSSTVGGGSQNEASGQTSTVAGGFSNTASGLNAAIGGGNGNSADGDRATVGGGRFNSAAGPFSTVPGGLGAVAPLHGQLAYAAGPFVNEGDAQWSVYTLRRETTNNVLTALLLDGASLANKITVQSGRTLAFDGLVVAQRASDGGVGFYKIQGAVANVSGSTNGFGITVDTIFEANVNWNVSVFAADADDTLTISVNGENNTTIRWVAVVRTVEVAFVP